MASLYSRSTLKILRREGTHRPLVFRLNWRLFNVPEGILAVKRSVLHHVRDKYKPKPFFHCVHQAMAYVVAIAVTVCLFLFIFLIVGLVNLLSLVLSPSPDANTTRLQRLRSLFLAGYIIQIPGRDTARGFFARMATYTAPLSVLGGRLSRGLFGRRREAQNTSHV
ncbi:hypothetical protein BDZ89DRAFT_1139644 [Hymenopellis radicata]|nr:hypothetical protein BDZ89DRAFT_1139644 [Hymenopellis radicata]